MIPKAHINDTLSGGWDHAQDLWLNSTTENVNKIYKSLAISHLRTIPIERKTIEILAEHLLHLNFELKIFDHANLQFLLQVHQNVHLL